MIEKTYNDFLNMTGEPIAAAMLTLAQVIEGKPERVALTVKEAAKAMGVSTDTIYDLCASGRLRHTKYGRRAIRIQPEALENLKAETTTGGKHKLRCLSL